MSKPFTFYCDPGHGWVAVHVSDLHKVGLSISDLSRYSYRRNDTCYLEEDCDAPKFIEAYRATNGTDPILRESHTNSSSFIRRLSPLHKGDLTT